MFNTVKTKILTLAGLPLLVAAVLSAIIIYSNYTVFREMKDVETLTQLGRKMSSLVHEMQKERGATGVFMGSKGAKFSVELPEQRNLTDEKRQEFEEALAAFKATDFPEFATALEKATEHLAGLDELRTKVSALSIPASEGIGFYTQHNGLMLQAISATAGASGDGRVRTQIYAYENYLLGKERAGIERAVMSNTFAADTFGNGLFGRFSNLMNEQDTYFRVFRSLASEEQIDFFDEKMSGAIIDEVQRMRDIAVAAASSGGFGVDPEHWFKTMTKKINLMKEVEDRLSHDLEQQVSALSAGARNTFVAISCIILAVFASLLPMIVVFSRKIVRPVLMGVEVAQAIANGDLTQEIDLSTASKDELGDLMRALNGMSSNLRGILQGIADYSGTLASSAEEMSAVSNQLVSNSEEMTAQSNTVASTTEEMSTNINTMASAAEEMSVNVQTVSSTSEQMSQNMNTVATAIEEMSATINDVAKNAGDASKVADDAVKMSTEATGTMTELGEAAREIGQVTEAIKRIAEQTNLLALNATIEAASAGDAGKGFAVVANEIKELANQSAQAAEDIATRIEGVQKSTGDAVTVIGKVAAIITTINESVTSIATAVEQQSSAANDIAANVGETNKGAQDIASSIAEVAKGANDMSKNAGEAARGANDVSSNIQGVSQASSDSNEGARQVNKSAEDLAKIAGDLQTLVAKFKVNNSRGSRPVEDRKAAGPPQPGTTGSNGHGVAEPAVSEAKPVGAMN